MNVSQGESKILKQVDNLLVFVVCLKGNLEIIQ